GGKGQGGGRGGFGRAAAPPRRIARKPDAPGAGGASGAPTGRSTCRPRPRRTCVRSSRRSATDGGAYGAAGAVWERRPLGFLQGLRHSGGLDPPKLYAGLRLRYAALT